MSTDFPYAGKIVSPVKCNEKPWDLWVSEIGHSSPRADDEGGAVFVSPADVDSKRRGARGGKQRGRRAGLHRLPRAAMPLHGLLPQADLLNAAVCHMCGATVKCSAVYRHLLESHSATEPIRPPPPPAPTVKLKPTHSRSRHKKEIAPPPPPVDILPVKMETSPIHTATAPLSRIVMPQPELQYLDEGSTSSGAAGELQVCVASGELPVVSIQDTDDLPLGENITDDIFAIMNSEGIQTADDITNSAEWKNIIRDIGNMQDINFSQPTDPVQSQELYTPIDPTGLSAYTIADTDLSSLQFAPNTSPMLSTVIDTNVLTAQALKPVTPVVATPPTKAQSRAKTSKSKFNVREYEPNKHCGVAGADGRPCTRSLTCKAHALSLRRLVEGRAKPFDTLLAEHRAARDAPTARDALPAPPLLVNTSLDLGAFSGLTAEQQVNDIYASLLSVEAGAAALPDAASLSSLLGQPLPPDLLLPDDAEPPPPPPEPVHLPAPIPAPAPAPAAAQLVPADVCWYAASPRPLALCTFNTAHAGGAVTLGKRFATVRSNIKSSLSRSQCKATAGASNNFYFGQNALSLSKSVHMNNASKASKPEVRKLVVTCGGGGARGALLNGHVRRHKPAKRAPALDLGFALDPMLADEKC